VVILVRILAEFPTTSCLLFSKLQLADALHWQFLEQIIVQVMELEYVFFVLDLFYWNFDLESCMLSSHTILYFPSICDYFDYNDITADPFLQCLIPIVKIYLWFLLGILYFLSNKLLRILHDKSCLLLRSVITFMLLI